jgi:predicted nucleic acid-binding protein
MHKGNRLSTAEFDAALPELERLWGPIYAHAVSDNLIEAASAVARDHALRAYDAMHLATITAFQEVRPLTLACWDKELRDAAQEREIPLIPERL